MGNTTPRTHHKLIYNNIGRGGGGYGDFSNILGGRKKFVCVQSNFGNDCSCNEPGEAFKRTLQHISFQRLDVNC